VSAPGIPVDDALGDREGPVLALDLGTRRIGMARSDSRCTMAFPLGVHQRCANVDLDHTALVAHAVELGARRVVIGLPLSLDGAEGTAARSARDEAGALEVRLNAEGIVVELFDERLTTVSAHAALAQAGKGSKQRRTIIDAAAAVILLDAWIDAK
jgi:putative holliday junction resolvase